MKKENARINLLVSSFYPASVKYISCASSWIVNVQTTTDVDLKTNSFFKSNNETKTT